MRIAVLGSPQSWYWHDLRRAAGADHELLTCTFRDLHAQLLPSSATIGSADVNLSACDALLVRTMPPGSLEQVVFRMDALARLEGAGQLVVNPARAVEMAVDKFLASAQLQAAGLLVPRTVACQTAEEAMRAFAFLGGDVVLKPIFGAEGRGIARVNDDALALRAFKMLEQLGAVLYLQEFIDHPGHDLRLLVIGDRVLGMRRVSADDWRTNISRGARAEPLEVTSELGSLALRAARALGAPLAGVDLLPDRNGQLYAIEVNAVPGWKALAAILHADVAKMVLDYLVAARRRGPINSGAAPEGDLS
jgi:ribosomal protein S6--L-glutamate ligase